MWHLALLAPWCSAPAAVPEGTVRRGATRQPDLMQAPVVWCLPEPTGAPWQCDKPINPLFKLVLALCWK